MAIYKLIFDTLSHTNCMQWSKGEKKNQFCLLKQILVEVIIVSIVILLFGVRPESF